MPSHSSSFLCQVRIEAWVPYLGRIGIGQKGHRYHGGGSRSNTFSTHSRRLSTIARERRRWRCSPNRICIHRFLNCTGRSPRAAANNRDRGSRRRIRTRLACIHRGSNTRFRRRGVGRDARPTLGRRKQRVLWCVLCVLCVLSVVCVCMCACVCVSVCV